MMIHLHKIDSDNNKGVEILLPKDKIMLVEARVYHTFRPPMGSKIYTINGSMFEVYESPTEISVKMGEVIG